MLDIETLKYPIGKFSPKEAYTKEELEQHINEIEKLPSLLKQTIAGFSNEQLNTPYREGGWTVKQVIHHLSDSHMNAFIRVKWALTESTPVIKAYHEKLWAETYETTADPQLSIALLTALHAKWVVLLRSLQPADFKKCFIHPDTQKEVSIERMIAMYSWHCRHHLTHITSLKERMKW